MTRSKILQVHLVDAVEDQNLRDVSNGVDKIAKLRRRFPSLEPGEAVQFVEVRNALKLKVGTKTLSSWLKRQGRVQSSKDKGQAEEIMKLRRQTQEMERVLEYKNWRILGERKSFIAMLLEELNTEELMRKSTP
jgi:hypothetical protein